MDFGECAADRVVGKRHNVCRDEGHGNDVVNRPRRRTEDWWDQFGMKQRQNYRSSDSSEYNASTWQNAAIIFVGGQGELR